MTVTLTDEEFGDIRRRLYQVIGNLNKNQWIYAFVDLKELYDELLEKEAEK